MNNFKTLIQNHSIRTFAKYIGVGFVNTIAWLLTMVICAYLYDNFVFYTAMGYIVSMLLSFILNLHYTFNASGDISKRIALFFLINVSNLIVVEFLQLFLINYLSWPEYFAITAGLLWYTLTGFFLNRKFVFAPRPIKTTEKIR